MISYLKGFVIERGEETITMDVNGVGYEVYLLTQHTGRSRE